MQNNNTKFPNNKTKDKVIASMIRVNHAGEYGAKRIYQGQMKALQKSNKFDTIKEMYKQELIHLQYFENEITRRNIRPTIMMPVWHIFGYTAGAISGLLGEKAAMACTVAVEEVIEQHYEKQIKELNKYKEEKELKNSIKKFKEEEEDHKEIGIENNALDTFCYNTFSSVIKKVTKCAIWISKRI